MTEATALAVALVGLAQFEDWPDFAHEALNLAAAYPCDLKLRDQIAGIAGEKWGQRDAVLRFWQEAQGPKLEVVTTPQVEAEPKPMKRRKLAQASGGDAERINAAIARANGAGRLFISLRCNLRSWSERQRLRGSQSLRLRLKLSLRLEP